MSRLLPIVFDLDGTLIDSLPGIAAAANALLEENAQPPLSMGRIAGFVGLGERVFLDRLIAASDLDRGHFDALLDRFLHHYTQASRSVKLYPHVETVLAGFRDRAVPVGLCTNKPSGPLEAVLKAAGLTGSFDAIVAGDTLAVRKPDPAPLRHVLRALGAGRGLFVGDSEVDAQTAVAAGVPFALFTEGIRTTPVEGIPHDHLFGDMRDLPAIHARVARAV